MLVTGARCGAGNAHSFRNTWLHSLWGVHDFTHSFYIHYTMYQSKDYVYRLMTGLFAWISLDSFVVDLFAATIRQINGLTAIKQFHHKRTHTSGVLNLNFRIYLQGGFNQVCMNILHFVFDLCVLITCIKIVIDSMIQEWCMHGGQYG